MGWVEEVGWKPIDGQVEGGSVYGNAEQKSGKIFHGWWVVLVAGVGLSLSYGPIIVGTFGVFLKPLSQEFGWSRTGISLAFSLANLVFSGALPLIGRLVDRLGARKVILPSVLIFGLGVMSFYFLYGQSLALLRPLPAPGGREQRDFAGLLQGDLPLV